MRVRPEYDFRIIGENLKSLRLADEFLSDEELLDRNDKAMKRKYELMTSGEQAERK